MMRSSLRPPPALGGFVVTLLAVAPAHAQGQVPPTQQRGPFSALAAGVSQPAGAGELLLKPAGDQTSPPSAWFSLGAFAANEPDYRLSAMFDDPTLIEIDAHSTGNALIPPFEEATGQLVLQTAWVGIFVSVTSTAEGVPGSVLRQRKQANGAVGADIIGHYLEGSVGISPTVVGKTFLEVGGEHVGLNPSRDEIDAWDFPMGVRSFTPTLTRRLLFTNTEEYYFSLTPSSASQLPAFAVDPTSPTGARVDAHPASIYVIYWGTDSWSEPYEYVSYTDLGFTAEEDDIDGLSVDGIFDRMLISTQLTTERSQLLVYEQFGGAPVTAHDQDNEPIEERLGLRVPTGGMGSVQDVDDIDAICDIDPEIPPGSVAVDNSVGIPTAPALPPLPITDDKLSLSVARTVTAPGRAGSLVLEATGPTDAAGRYVFMVSWDFSAAQGSGAAPNWITFLPARESAGFAHVELSVPAGASGDRLAFAALFARADPLSVPWIEVSPAVEIDLTP